MSLNNATAPAHVCQSNPLPALLTPSRPTYPMRCKDCGGNFDSTKHQMTCVAPNLIDPRDAEIARLNLQNSELRAEVKKLHDGHGYRNGVGPCVCKWCNPEKRNHDFRWEACSEGGLFVCKNCDARYCSPPWTKDNAMKGKCES